MCHHDKPKLCGIADYPFISYIVEKSPLVVRMDLYPLQTFVAYIPEYLFVIVIVGMYPAKLPHMVVVMALMLRDG